jgi:hypothetical protein
MNEQSVSPEDMNWSVGESEIIHTLMTKLRPTATGIRLNIMSVCLIVMTVGVLSNVLSQTLCKIRMIAESFERR